MARVGCARRRSIVLVLTCLAGTNGCMAYRGERWPNVIANGVRATASEAPHIGIVLHQENEGHEKQPWGMPPGKRKLQQDWETVRQETPCLVNASAGATAPDFVLDLSTRTAFQVAMDWLPNPGTPDPRGAGAALLAVLGILPVFYSEHFIVTATLKSASGETLGTHSAFGRRSYVRHLLLLPVALISSFWTRHFYADTFRDVLVDVARDLEAAQVNANPGA